MDVESLVRATASWHPAAVWAALFGGALIEYVFPPFPGDTVVVAGAGLVGANGWAVGPVWLAVTAGSVVGAALDLQLGRWIADGRLDRLSPRTRAAVDTVVERFRRYGAAYLALNRFVPGVRAAFFVAAGIAGLRTGPVLAWATVSAVLWNTALVGVGLAVGRDLDRLAELFRAYQTAAWVAVGLAVVIAVVRMRRR